MLWRRGKAYGQDLRERVFAAADIGTPVGEIAELLFVSISFVSKALSRRAGTGETTARPQRCHVPPKLATLYVAISEQVAATPDTTLAELKVWLLEAHGVEASTTLIWETLAKLDLTLKKDVARLRTGSSGCRDGTQGLAAKAVEGKAEKARLH
jgi:transposase